VDHEAAVVLNDLPAGFQIHPASNFSFGGSLFNLDMSAPPELDNVVDHEAAVVLNDPNTALDMLEETDGIQSGSWPTFAALMDVLENPSKNKVHNHYVPFFP
jgi:hypothetical protein